jgi:hypothetical protein
MIYQVSVPIGINKHIRAMVTSVVTFIDQFKFHFSIKCFLSTEHFTFFLKYSYPGNLQTPDDDMEF